MKIQHKKTKIVTTMMTSLIIGLMMFSPTIVLPNVSAQPQPQMVTFDTSALTSEQVMTPFGAMDKVNVHHYNGTVIDADKILAKYQADVMNGKTKQFNISGRSGVPGLTNWNEYAYWDSTSNLNRFNGYWTVPSAPTSTYSSTTNPQQALYLFLGLMDSHLSPSLIIQPVLQWGYSQAYGGNNWELVSWMVIGNQAYYSTPISANVGDTIYGDMTLNFGQTWTITTKDVTKNTSTAEQVSTSHNFIEADVTLETANTVTQQCSYLPGNTGFTSMTMSGGSSFTSWTAAGSPQWCHMSVQRISQSAVTLHTQS